MREPELGRVEVAATSLQSIAPPLKSGRSRRPRASANSKLFDLIVIIHNAWLQGDLTVRLMNYRALGSGEMIPLCQRRSNRAELARATFLSF